jgi:hypothetical protein
MAHPYKNLPPHNFWRKGVTSVPRPDLILPVDTTFKIGKTDKVATAGSCFAQHLAAGLQKSGFDYFVPENAPDLDAETLKKRNYGVYSARYGNIYTTLQLLQLLQEAYGQHHPHDCVWQGQDGRIYDPYRPAIEPNGFASESAMRESRKILCDAVRRIVEESDIFVFTMGLTETWRNKADGTVYPVVPGAVVGDYDPERHEFLNMPFNMVRSTLEDVIHFFKERNPTVRFVLTVSPVPLVATYENRHVLSSTTYSKAVLRSVAEEISRAHDDVTYFPSYEIITSHFNAGLYFDPDLRNVSMRGVRHVMRNFMQEMTDDGDAYALQSVETRKKSERDVQELTKLVCEEEYLDK